MKTKSISDHIVKFILSSNDEDLKDMSVTLISKSFGLSRSYLSRKFRCDKEFTLKEFIQREKMYRSALLLKERKDLSIKDLAGKVGFSTSDYFIKVVKKHFGTAPCIYRNCINGD